MPGSLPLPHVDFVPPHPAINDLCHQSPVLVVRGEAVDHDGDGEGEDEYATEGAQSSDQFAGEGGG